MFYILYYIIIFRSFMNAKPDFQKKQHFYYDVLFSQFHHNTSISFFYKTLSQLTEWTSAVPTQGSRSISPPAPYDTYCERLSIIWTRLTLKI